MGSFDRQPEDWDRYADSAWAPAHVIFCNSRWQGKDKHDHTTVDAVRACYDAARDEKKGIEVWPCSWLVELRYDDGTTYTVECGLPARFTAADGSYACIGGHDHVPAETRLNEGWDYCTEDEAAGLARAGTVPVDMQGRPWL